MAAYTRNTPSTILGNKLDLEEEEESLEFRPVSTTTSTIPTKNNKEKEKEAKRLRKKEKKQKSRLENSRLKQAEKRERDRQAFAGNVTDQISLYHNSRTGTDQKKTALETASQLLDESERLMEEVNAISDPTTFDAASKDEESFVSQISAIKAKQEAEKEAERDAFLAAKKRKEDKKKRKKEKDKLSKEEKKTKKEEKKSKAAKEKAEREKVKVDAKANFKEREKEHKAKLKKKKDEEKARKKAVKEQKEMEKERKKVEKMAGTESSEYGDDAEQGRRHSSRFSRRFSSGLGLFRMPSSKKPKDRESIRTKKGIKPRTDMLNLWGVEASKTF